MRKIQLSVSALLMLFCFSASMAQVKQAQPLVRCATEDVIQENLRTNPDFRAEFERKNAPGTQLPSSNGTSRLSALSGPVTIPVIVHVVLPNPNIVTEEQIDYFLSRLNIDYSGLNPDSTNGTLFYPVRGHSLLRFTRARRTPAGQITNGIERRVGGGAIATTTYQAIKHASSGGLDPWDVTQYYNLWVGDGGASGLLGIAPAIGVGAQTETTTSTTGIDGVCVDYRGFSNGCFSYAAFALGRTAVHEIGHNFGLYHTFSGCAAGADFAQPTPAGQTLPANLVGATGDDTPGLATATSGCPTGAVASGCAGSTTPPGKMYQNYMDYTDDPCYSMFTKNQVARMEYMLENYRPGYLTTQGAVPPAGYPSIDAGLNAIVSPGGSEFNNTTCAVTSYPTPSCPGAITPRVAVTNYGATTITSIIATVTVNGTTSAPQTFAVNLITNRTATLAFPNVNLVAGNNTITFNIVSVNGATDSYTTNNSLSTTLNVSSQAFPFTQDFVTTTFPPPNMSIFNPNNNNTWVRSASGNGTAGSAFINNYSTNLTGQIDDIRTLPLAPPAGAAVTDSLIVSFDLAYRPYSLTNSTYFDTLKVLVSTDCGATFTTVYSRWATSTPSLATGAVNTGSYTTPAAADWRRERIALNGTYLRGGNIIVAFRNISKYGNNIFLDNINVVPVIILRRDLQLVSVNQPATVTCSAITPNITVTNKGVDTLTAFKAAYTIDNGAPTVVNIANVAIAPNASYTAALTGATLTAGTHTIKVYTYDPVSTSGTGDQNVANDTLTRIVRVYGDQSAPLSEGFEGATFPPTGWVLNNVDGLTTWQRTTRAARGGSASAYMNNYNYATNNSRDELYTPRINYTASAIDSLFLDFDVAATTYSYPGSTAIPLDTLEVLLTNNCGATYTSIYKKWGNQLQTVSDPNSPQTTEFVPTSASQWRRERINLTPFFAQSNVELVFRNTTNYENNIFIDNVNVSTKTLPAKLKEQGYLIYPSPFMSSFTIQHYLSPTDLRGIGVYNSVGQLVFSRSFSTGAATSTIQVDMSKYASDVYTVVLHYTNRTISQKVIKVH